MTKSDFNKKRTLKCYYESLPSRKTPRKEFITEVSARCGVSEQTVRNWCLYDIKPQNFMHIKVLSEMTGIKEEDLWKD